MKQDSDKASRTTTYAAVAALGCIIGFLYLPLFLQ